MLEDLKEIISIPSEMGEPLENAPFGKECRRALDWFLNKAKEMGFETGEMDGYCGWAEYGEGERCIGILCHLDVVPAGDGWSFPPYDLTISEGKLFGRGVVDDKGSVVMSLHALRDIKNSGAKLTHRIRIIVGCNEEHGSACIKHYVECGGEIPVMSYVPDSDFPLINSEKGILHLMVSLPLDSFFKENVAFISGGESYNVVPDCAKLAVFKDSPFGKKILALADGEISNKIFHSPTIVGGLLANGFHIEDFSVCDEGEVITFETKGIAGHAMAPDRADNAIRKILFLLFEESELAQKLGKYVFDNNNVKNLGIYKSDEVSGDLTMSCGIIRVDDSRMYFSLDMRLPICSSPDEIKKAIMNIFAKAKIEEETFAHNLFIPKDSELVKTLLGVYENATGDKGECLICGGGTYARELPNAVAFGPTFQGTETNIHNIDECVPVNEFYRAAEIYKCAMLELAK